MIKRAAAEQPPPEGQAPLLPLVRLRVDYTGFSTVNAQKFGQRFVGKVANPQVCAAQAWLALGGWRGGRAAAGKGGGAGWRGYHSAGDWLVAPRLGWRSVVGGWCMMEVVDW